MNIKLLFILLLTVSCKAQTNSKEMNTPTQTTLHATGMLRDEYNVPGLSDAMQRLLFAMERGDIYLPERGFFLDLKSEDAKRLAAKYILVIPLFQQANTDIFYGNYDQALSFELIPIPGATNVYYSKNVKWFNAHNRLKANEIPQEYPATIFSQASQKDTITWASFSNYNDLRDVSKWIDKLDSKEQVTVHHIGCAETSDGYKDMQSFETITLSELAKQRMRYVSSNMQMLNAPKSDAPKKEWKHWIENVQNTEIALPQHDPALEHKISFNQSGYNIVRADEANNTINRLACQPNYTNYADQQFVTFNIKENSFKTATIFDPKQNTIHDFIGFFADKDILYALNENGIWQKFVPNTKGSVPNLLLTEKKDLLNANLRKKIGGKAIIIDAVQMNDQLSFVLLHADKTSDYELFCLITATGEVVSHSTLKKAAEFNEKMQYQPFHNEGGNPNIFAVLVKSAKGVHHLEFNMDLTKTNDVFLGKDFQWYPHYIDARGRIAGVGRNFYYDRNEDNGIDFYVWDSGKVQTISAPLQDRLFDGIILKRDGENLRLFYEYGGAYTHGIRTQLIDMTTFQLIDAPKTVFSTVQIENESSENTPINLDAFKVRDQWYVTFSIDNDYYVMEVSK